MKKIFKINGIDCVSCKLKLETLLNEMKGVNAEIDYDTKIATIEFPDALSQENLLKKIKAAGYDAIEL